MRIAPRHTAALKALGVLQFSTGDAERGLATLKRATECTPNDAEAWSNYGNALRAVDRHSESALACARAVELDP
ncbi:tetratricopeptide repeat protein, partial [Acinetobacter baumannii]